MSGLADITKAAAAFTESVEELNAKFRDLSLREEALKCDLELARQNLAAVRELKARIGQRIFNVSSPTNNNGPRPERSCAS